MVELISFSSAFELSPTLQANETVRLKRARGETVYQMGFGQAPFPVPDLLQETLAKYAGENAYVAAAGIEPLREKVAAYYQEKTGLDISQYDVLIAPGSKLILYAVQMAVKGDLLMPVPSWVSYAPQARMVQTNVIKVPTALDEQGYHIDANELRAVIKNARAEGFNPSKIILNYPNNPTGLTILEDELKSLAQVCVDEDILIISDEIYGFVRGDEYQSISRYAPQNTIVTTGLSKHMSLGGWRLGVAFVPKGVPGLFGMLRHFASELWSCVPPAIQEAAVEAYSGKPEIEKHVVDCNTLHGFINGYIAERFRDMGVIAPPPQGAFYNYPNFEPFRGELAQVGIKDSSELASVLLEKYNISALPGVAFGEEPDVLTLRISGCDFDGAVVLEAYQRGKVPDEAFIEAYAPNVKAAMDQFSCFISDVRGNSGTHKAA